MEYIEGSLNLSAIKSEKVWKCILCQLSYFIYILERNKIQHNDFHLGNVIVQNNKIKIIDLETIIDYKNKEAYSRMIKYADKEEHERMGWSKQFHPGSDLNQILGEILDNFGDALPKKYHKIISDRVIRYDKEFPYAISESNGLTTGEEMMKLLECKED